MTYLKLLLISVISMFTLSQSISNKMIYLISPPRQLSTAFARMMLARGDFTILHEPSLCPFCIIHDPKIVDGLFLESAPRTYKQAQQLIKETAKEQPVFAKEISYSVKELLLADMDWIKDANIYFVILVRDVHHAIISFYKKWMLLPSGFAKDFAKWLGYEETLSILKHLEKHATNKPHIILSEELSNNPVQTIQAFCAVANIPYLEHALHWSELKYDFTEEKKWIEFKKSDDTHFWHDNALNSDGIYKTTNYHVDEQGEPTFIEIANLDDRKFYMDLYEKHLPYYKDILKYKVTYGAPDRN